MESLFQLLIKILFFTSGYCIKVDYLRGIPRLGNSSYWDYYFNCNTEGQTLQWEVNGNSLGGFLNEDVARVFSSSRSNFDYVATLLSATPASGIQYKFVSMLIVSSLGYSNLEVICRSDLSLSMTNNTENRTYVEDMTNTSLIVLQYLLNEEIVSADSFRIRIFVCGVDYFFLNWQTDIKICTFTTSDTIGQNLQTLTQNDTAVLQQALFIAQEPYPIVSILLVTGNSDVNVKCRNSEGTLQFSIATASTETENEPITTELYTRRPMDTNTSSIDGIILVAIVSSTVVLLLALIIIVIIVVMIGKTRKRLNIRSELILNLQLLEQPSKREQFLQLKLQEQVHEPSLDPQQPELFPNSEPCLNLQLLEQPSKCKQFLQLKLQEQVQDRSKDDPYEEDILEQTENYDFKNERLERYNISFTYDDFRKFMDYLEPEELYFEFEFIKAESKKYSKRTAKKNKARNRFQDELPSDACRVKLEQVNDGDSDYINASYIDGYKQERAYIVTQTPMNNTEGHFWKMIYEQRVRIIVVFISHLLKEDFNPFWPNNKDDEKKHDYLTVLCEECSSESSWKIWKLKLSNSIRTDKTLHVTFYGYSDYSHGVPMNATSGIQLIKRVNDDRRKLSVSTPIVLVSTIGTGRTGVFITLDAMMKQMVDEEKTFCIFKFVLDMWGQRKKMVRTLAQYKFIYNTLKELIERDDLNLHEPHEDHEDLSLSHAPQMQSNSAAIETDQMEEIELEDVHQLN